jgi:hypothetical protein
MYVAFRDAASGQEFLHRQRDVAERGLHLTLDAYKTHVFLEWRDIRDDGTRPWGLLCDSLGGRGVSSLEDALRALELKPVHDAVFALLDSRLMQSVAECALPSATGRPEGVAGEVTSLKVAVTPPSGNGHREQTFTALRHLFNVVLAESKRFASTRDGEAAGLKPAREWSPGRQDPAEFFLARVKASLRLPAVLSGFSQALLAQASVVFPTAGTAIEKTLPLWSAVVAWAALESIGLAQDAASPCECAVAVFDVLRLREAIAEAMAKLGMHGEDRWRSVARIRASFAHASWCPAPDAISRRAPVLSWEHDPDVAWILGVHEHEGARYFNKESFEQLVWWSALPALLELAENAVGPAMTSSKLADAILARFKAAEEGGYRVESLLYAARQTLEDEK